MDRDIVGDRTLTCADCGLEFTFSVAEQRFHRGLGFADPVRCAACSHARAVRRLSPKTRDAGRAGIRPRSGGGGASRVRDPAL